MHPIAILLAVLVNVLALGPASAQSFPPADYKFQPVAPCLEDAERASKPLRPGAAVYQVCSDQMAVLTKGLADAKAAGKLLLVTFGATWCPYCAALQKAMPTADVLDHPGSDFRRTFHHIEIGVSTIDKGNKAQIPSGDATLKAVLKHAPGVKIRAIPFLAVIDPNKPERVYARNVDDTAGQDGGFDFAKFRGLLTEAQGFVRGAGAAPNEPSWLVRKWLRFWNT